MNKDLPPLPLSGSTLAMTHGISLPVQTNQNAAEKSCR